MKKTVFFSALSLLALLAYSGCSETAPEKKISESSDESPKIVIYQMLVRVFGNTNTTNVYNGTRAQNGCGHMSDVSSEALQSIKRLGCNYVWYTGIIQQATKTDWSEYGIPRQHPAVVKGNAGSPYAITDYYAVSAELADSVPARNEEFVELVNRTHEAGLKVIIDFVPNHVARQYHSVCCPKGTVDLGSGDKTEYAFNLHNNFYYFPGQTLKWTEVSNESEKAGQNMGNAYVETPARVTGNNVFGSVTPSVDDWYETVKLNYGIEFKPDGSQVKTWLDKDGSTRVIPATWTQMSDILLYWCGKGVDGFRCDVSEMVPVEFWNYGISRVKEKYPNTLFIAEIYNPKAYLEYIETGGFDYLYDKVEMYDSLRAVVEGKRDILAIQHCAESPTIRNPKIHKHRLHFLENHDEQRVASKFFGHSAQAGIPALYISVLLNNNPFLIYFGQELGEESMDNEGFNGADGRTTIFDYWGLETMKTWHEANWDESKLPLSYRNIRNRYEEVFRLAQLPVIRNGACIDITTPEMIKANVFGFRRKAGAQELTVFCNFGDEPFEYRHKRETYKVKAHDAIAILKENK